MRSAVSALVFDLYLVTMAILLCSFFLHFLPEITSSVSTHVASQIFHTILLVILLLSFQVCPQWTLFLKMTKQRLKTLRIKQMSSSRVCSECHYVRYE